MLRILPWNGRNNPDNVRGTETTTDLTTTRNDLIGPRASLVQSFVRRSLDNIVGFGHSFVNRQSDTSKGQRVRDLEKELRRLRAHCKLCVEKSWEELECVEKEKDVLILKCEALEKENFELRHGKGEMEEKVSDSGYENITRHSSISFEKFKQRQMKWFDGLDVSDETRGWIMANDSAKQITKQSFPQTNIPKSVSIEQLDTYTESKDSQHKRRHFSAFGFFQKNTATDRERELLEHNATLQDELNELTLHFVEIENQLEEKEEIIAELRRSKELEVKPHNSSDKSESVAAGEDDVELYVDFGHRDNV